MADPTATFDPGLSTPKDEVRQRIGDTDVSDGAWDVADQTITAYLTTMGLSVLAASVRLANELSAKYARQADLSVDRQANNAASISANFRKLAITLQAELDREGAPPPTAGPPSLGGIAVGSIMVTGLRRYSYNPRNDDPACWDDCD